MRPTFTLTNQFLFMSNSSSPTSSLSNYSQALQTPHPSYFSFSIPIFHRKNANNQAFL